jgi:hypothetical protein
VRYQELCFGAFVLGAAIASDNCRHSRNMRLRHSETSGNPWFKRSTVYRRAVDVLWTATEPMTSKGDCGAVLAAANIKRPDRLAFTDLIGTINSSLRNHAR